MSSCPFLKTVRITKSTRLRAQNMLNVVALFKDRSSLTLLDVYTELNYSASGARNHVASLVRMGVLIAQVHKVKHNESRNGYRLTENTALLEQFKETMKAHIANVAPKQTYLTSAQQTASAERKQVEFDEPVSVTPRRGLTPYERFPDRQIHLLADDVHIATRMTPNRGEGKRDPLVAALFGPAKRPSKFVIETS